MAHEKVYGICENKCKVEVYPKEQTYSKDEVSELTENAAKLGVTTRNITLTNKYNNNLAADGYKTAEVTATIPTIDGYMPVGIAGYRTEYGGAGTVLVIQNTTNFYPGGECSMTCLLSPYFTTQGVEIEPKVYAEILYKHL